MVEITEEAFLEGKIPKTSDKKKKKDVEISKDTGIDKKNNNGVTYNHQQENTTRKKRRKLKPFEDNDKSCKEIQMKEEERLCLQTDAVNDLGIESKVKRLKSKKKEKKGIQEEKDRSLSSQSSLMLTLMVTDMDEYVIVHKQRSPREDNVYVKNKKKGHEVCDLKRKKKTAAKEVGKAADKDNVDAAEKVEKKKRKNDSKKGNDISCTEMPETLAKDLGNVSKDIGNKTRGVETNNGKNLKSSATASSDPKTKRKLKNVTISSEVEVFPASDSANKGNKKKEEGDGLVRGKRFSPEEDEIVKEAVLNYIQDHRLGEEGLAMVLNCSSHSKIKNCWKDIAAALPERPRRSVYCRAHTLFERDENRKWSAEELELVKKYHEKHGPKWKELADELGKHRIHLKDAWRRIKLPKMKRGPWSQKEYQNLFDLVNEDLRAKVYEEKKSKYGMLRDNISWSAISDTLETRRDAMCCLKWYDQLSSPMIKQKIWADVDDYRMLISLYELDVCCEEDLDWDDVLEHRTGDVCRRRWNQMYNHIGEHGCKSFADQVEVLLKRYCPDLLEAREIWDNKPVLS